MLPTSSTRHIVIHAKGKRRPVFWVQPGPVQAAVLRQLGSDQPVYCLDRLKPDPSRPPLRFEEIAAYHIDTMRSLCPHGPYALAGYCVYGAIAFEIASQLRTQGEIISSLILIDPVDPAISRAELIQEPPLFRFRFNFNRVLFHLQKIRQCTAKDKLAYCMESVNSVMVRLKFRRLANVPSSAAASDKLVGVHESDVYAFSNHVPLSSAGFAIILRPTIKPPEAYEYPNRRWAELISGGLNVREVPGDSNNMWLMPNARDMAQTIHSCLDLIPSIPFETFGAEGLVPMERRPAADAE